MRQTASDLSTEVAFFTGTATLARMITPAQCRAARGLLNWTQADLARIASVGKTTVHQFEISGGEPRPATLTVIRLALEAAGVEFIPGNGSGPGVRLKKNETASGD